MGFDADVLVREYCKGYSTSGQVGKVMSSISGSMRDVGGWPGWPNLGRFKHNSTTQRMTHDVIHKTVI